MAADARTLAHRGSVAADLRRWAVATVSGFGSYVTGLAMGVLVVDLGGSAKDVDRVNAARWAPYLVIGMAARRDHPLPRG